MGRAEVLFFLGLWIFRDSFATIYAFPTSGVMPTRSQKLVIVLAFAAAALSFAAAGVRLFRDGAIEATPLFGGLFMLALGVAGYRRLKARPDVRERIN